MYVCEVCGKRFRLHISLTMHSYYGHSSSPKYMYYARCTRASQKSIGVKIYIPREMLINYEDGHRDYYIIKRLEDPSEPPAFILYFSKNPPHLGEQS